MVYVLAFLYMFLSAGLFEYCKRVAEHNEDWVGVLAIITIICSVIFELWIFGLGLKVLLGW
jgi:hypothetical protein